MWCALAHSPTRRVQVQKIKANRVPCTVGKFRWEILIVLAQVETTRQTLRANGVCFKTLANGTILYASEVFHKLLPVKPRQALLWTKSVIRERMEMNSFPPISFILRWLLIFMLLKSWQCFAVVLEADFHIQTEINSVLICSMWRVGTSDVFDIDIPESSSSTSILLKIDVYTVPPLSSSAINQSSLTFRSLNLSTRRAKIKRMKHHGNEILDVEHVLYYFNKVVYLSLGQRRNW